MYSDHIEKRFGDIIRENEKLKEQLLKERELSQKERELYLKDQEQLKKYYEDIINAYRKFLEKNGIFYS